MISHHSIDIGIYYIPKIFFIFSSQVLKFKQQVRGSDPIKLALKFFSAMRNNNYVSFFRLMRQKATFLQCCLLHRYIPNVRKDALRTIVKTHGISSCHVSLTLVQKFQPIF